MTQTNFLYYASQDTDAARLGPDLRLKNQGAFSTPWPGKEAAYAKFMDTQFIPAWRAAGLPE